MKTIPIEEQKERMRELITQLRQVASQVGPLHAYWDGISDMESFLSGARPMLHMSAGEWIEYAEKCLSPSAEVSHD